MANELRWVLVVCGEQIAVCRFATRDAADCVAEFLCKQKNIDGENIAIFDDSQSMAGKEKELEIAMAAAEEKRWREHHAKKA
jgi:hypothetical protein